MKTKTNTDVRTKRIPERTCIACREVKPKKQMVRIVKTIDRGVLIDETGKISGRGAYLCRVVKCWNEGLKGNRLEHVLRAVLSLEDKRRLEDYKQKLKGESSGA